MGHLRDLPFIESDSGAETRGDSPLRDQLVEQDGQPEARESDHADASSAAVGPSDDHAQEIPPGAEGLITWDVSPDDAGHLVAEVEAEDEAVIPATMAEQGRDDADEDLRRDSRANTG